MCLCTFLLRLYMSYIQQIRRVGNDWTLECIVVFHGIPVIMYENGAPRVGHHQFNPGPDWRSPRGMSPFQGLTIKHAGAALQKTCWDPKIGREQAVNGESRQAYDTAFSPCPLIGCADKPRGSHHASCIDSRSSRVNLDHAFGNIRLAKPSSSLSKLAPLDWT